MTARGALHGANESIDAVIMATRTSLGVPILMVFSLGIKGVDFQLLRSILLFIEFARDSK